MCITQRDQRMPKQYKKYLSNGDNKEILFEFLFQQWQSASCIGNVELFVCHGKQCCVIHKSQDDSNTVNEVSELETYHEEADTRMILHASHTHSTVILKNPDTDVMVLGTAFAIGIPSHLLSSCRSESMRLVNLSAISVLLGQNQSEPLLGLHVFSGCDHCQCL